MCELKNKFEEWKRWLFGDDSHSIYNQIHNMIWDSAFFQSVNEARRYAPIDDKGEPELNKMTHGFINHSFFQTQALAIRRLLDKETREGARSVFSLYRLLHDIEQNCQLLTREKILTALDFPYDYEEGLKILYEMISQKKSPGDLVNYKYSKSMHKNIDSLTGVSASKRNPNDTVRKEVFGWLKERLSDCEDLYNYVNKFLAHSATPESRHSIQADDIKITLGKILETHKTICETAQFVSLTLLFHSLGNFLVIPKYDQFEHFEKPWVPESVLPKLNSHWQAYYKETMTWKDWDWQKDFKAST